MTVQYKYTHQPW